MKARVTGLLWGKPPVIGGFPQKGPVTQKVFPRDEVVMFREYDIHKLTANIDPSMINMYVTLSNIFPLWFQLIIFILYWFTGSTREAISNHITYIVNLFLHCPIQTLDQLHTLQSRHSLWQSTMWCLVSPPGLCGRSLESVSTYRLFFRVKTFPL